VGDPAATFRQQTEWQIEAELERLATFTICTQGAGSYSCHALEILFMVKTPLTVVPGSDGAELYNLSKGPESVADRVKRLQAEAHMLAREEVQALENQLRAAVAKASEIAKGGEAYPAGVRELAERMADDIEGRAQTLQAIVERTWR
jgi:hypothetical protein